MRWQILIWTVCCYPTPEENWGVFGWGISETKDSSKNNTKDTNAWRDGTHLEIDHNDENDIAHLYLSLFKIPYGLEWTTLIVRQMRYPILVHWHLLYREV